MIIGPWASPNFMQLNLMFSILCSVNIGKNGPPWPLSKFPRHG